MGSNERRRRSMAREAIVLVLVALALFGGGAYYFLSEPSGPEVKVTFSPSNPDAPKFTLEVAATPGARVKGLMFRRELEPDRGMLFVSPEETVQTFWMKNTYIPLDILFLDSNWKVVGIIDNVPILNLEPRKIDTPSKYVIELGAGVADRFNIGTGARVKIVSGELPAIY